MLLFTMVNSDKTSQSICESNILSTCKINYTLCTKKYLMKSSIKQPLRYIISQYTSIVWTHNITQENKRPTHESPQADMLYTDIKKPSG